MITEINGLLVYESEAFKKYKDKVNYFVTTRLGGVSKFPYESLNIAFKNVEDRNNVYKNLEIVCSKLSFNKENAVCVYEDHTDEIVVITEKNKKDYLFSSHHDIVADSMITNMKNVPLIITIADCNAIVLYDPKNNVVANIHSGWKGTTKRIALKTLEKMVNEFGTNPADIICSHSPSIQSCCWKTKDKALVEGLKSFWDYQDEYVKEDAEGWIHVDFPYVITKELTQAGVKEENIFNEKICTCCNVDKFFSYRRKTELGEPNYGVQISIIELI